MENQIVRVELSDGQTKLWRQFDTHTTEMVVTKTGRKMFPKLEYCISGLESDTQYALFLHIESVDEQRYKFSNGQWTTSGKGEAQLEVRRITHSDGTLYGRQWMANPICFDNVKITNNANDNKPSHIYLHSMHKYIPVLSIYRTPPNSPAATELVHTARLEYTSFIAVTAYQNQTVTSLKIANNPFAKGFRENTGDRKRTSPSSDESQLSSPTPPSAKRSRTVTPPPPPMVSTPYTPTFFHQPPPTPMFNPYFQLPLFQQMAMYQLAAAQMAAANLQATSGPATTSGPAAGSAEPVKTELEL